MLKHLGQYKCTVNCNFYWRLVERKESQGNQTSDEVKMWLAEIHKWKDWKKIWGCSENGMLEFTISRMKQSKGIERWRMDTQGHIGS